MANKHGIGKNIIGPNQPPSQEFKDSVDTSKRSFKFPLNYIASQHTRRYPLDITTPTIPDPTYTSSHDIPSEHQDSSSNKEIQGTIPEEYLYHVPNTKVDQLCRRTQVYLKSIGEISIIYKIPRSQASQRRTQPYGEDKTLISNIDDLIIDHIL